VEEFLGLENAVLSFMPGTSPLGTVMNLALVSMTHFTGILKGSYFVERSQEECIYVLSVFDKVALATKITLFKDDLGVSCHKSENVHIWSIWHLSQI